MRKNSVHCQLISRRPVIATTTAGLKLQYLGDFIEYMSLLRRAAPWGIAWPKGFVGEEGGGDNGGLPGGGDGNGGGGFPGF